MVEPIKMPAVQRLPEWRTDAKGRKKLHGRWNLQRMAEFLIENPSWQTMDDIARVVYNFTSKTHRDNVRKHIPAQRRFMLNSLDQPIVTQYGERGKIMRIKLYNKTDEEDRIKFKMELDRALARAELSEQRYGQLLSHFLLPKAEVPPS